jgi:hypothetical protein
VSAASTLAILREPLESMGFRKRSGRIFTVELHPDVLGWLGLNTASRHQAPGALEVNPVVGVRHQVVEHLVAELRRETFHPFQPPTVCTPLGYAMPAGRYQAWVLTQGPDAAARASLIDAVTSYGLPFMSGLAAIESLCAAAEQGVGFNLEYRLPVIRLLLGRTRDAQAGLDDDLSRLGVREDRAAEQLRSFAGAFSARLADGSLS